MLAVPARSEQPDRNDARGIAHKWLELLKELAPQTEHVALLYDPQNPATTGYRTVIKAGAPPFQVQISEYPVRSGQSLLST